MAGIAPTAENSALALLNSQAQGQSLVTSGASAATAALPALGLSGAATAGVGAAIGIAVIGIASIFAAHDKAVKAEAKSENNAIPRYFLSLHQIEQAYNAGQIDAKTAAGYVDTAVRQYYEGVTGIIRGIPTGPPATAKKPSVCNGPCTLAYYWILPAAKHFKDILAEGGGTFTTSEIPPHAGFNGYGSDSYALVAPVPILSALANVPGVGPIEQAVSHGLDSLIQSVAPGVKNTGALKLGLLVAGFFGVLILGRAATR